MDPAAGSHYRPSLSEGRLLAGRFEIVRFIARGGMGEVYEAKDVELGERVALKTVRPDLAQDSLSWERFKREIQLARRVTHPNVCRIFDVFHHTEPPAPGAITERITFLSMELLRGETLTQRVRRAGPFSPEKALPVVLQMTAALSAAHAAGVVHRDFKSANVVLTPIRDDGEEFRVVVTDFGLARSSAAGDTMTTLSADAGIAGTPDYMAPEQLEGGEVGSAADIYALGVVMYEMVTGTLPFAADSAVAAALKRFREAPVSPRAHCPELSSEWETCILQCLERNPADRPASADEVAGMLAPRRVQPADREARRAATGGASWRSKLRLMAVAGAVLLALFISLSVLGVRYRSASDVSGSRRSVAVLGFANLTGDADSAWLSTALTEMLTTELAAGEDLRTIAAENVARMKTEFALPSVGALASDTLTRIRNYLGADIVIVGSYTVLRSSKIGLDLRVQDSVKGDLVGAIRIEGDPANLFDVVSRSGAELRALLGIGELEPMGKELVRASLPANSLAARFYAEGLDKLRLFDALGARSSLEKAVSADSRHALARSALATSWSMLGYGRRAKEEAKIALDLSVNLPREQQLLVKARSQEAARDWDEAVKTYQALFEFFPDNLDYGIRLAGAQTSADRPKDAIQTLQILRKTRAFSNDSYRIDLTEARAAGALSDFTRQQRLAAAVAEKGRAEGARLLAAGARLLEGNAHANLGNLEQARAAFEEARQMYIDYGDRWDAANAAVNLASVLFRSGDPAAAKKIYEDSLATYNELDDQGGRAATLVSLGNLFRSQSDMAGSRRMHEQALSIYRATGDRIGEATSLNNIANVLALTGDLKGAKTMYAAALPIFHDVGNENGAATVLGNLGDILADEGDLAAAAERHQQSSDIFRRIANNSALAHALSRTAELLLIQGDLAGARKRHEEAMALREKLGEHGGVADSQLALAHILLQEGLAEKAAELAQSALVQFQREKRTGDAASAESVLARSLFAQKKQSLALQAIERAEKLSVKGGNRNIQISVAITAASIRAQAGDIVKAMNDLAVVAAEARKIQLVGLEFEARLALGELELASGRLESGRDRLAMLEREASSKGYKLVAERARAAQRRAAPPQAALKRATTYPANWDPLPPSAALPLEGGEKRCACEAFPPPFKGESRRRRQGVPVSLKREANDHLHFPGPCCIRGPSERRQRAVEPDASAA